MLVKCTECGGTVSSKAETCPHCGAPVDPLGEPVAETERKEISSAHDQEAQNRKTNRKSKSTHHDRSSVKSYGEELGVGIKKGMRGLNTVASPKKRKVVAFMILIPLVFFIILFAIGMSTGNDNIAYIGLTFGFCLGIYQFYLGNIKKGLIYTLSIGGICIGCLLDLLKVVFTQKMTDANGFPLIY